MQDKPSTVFHSLLDIGGEVPRLDIYCCVGSDECGQDRPVGFLLPWSGHVLHMAQCATRGIFRHA